MNDRKVKLSYHAKLSKRHIFMTGTLQAPNGIPDRTDLIGNCHQMITLRSVVHKNA